MRILIAPDSYKESLGAADAARAIAAGLLAEDPSLELDLCPVADGGEGTVAALAAATGGELRTATVRGPLGASVEASFLLTGELAVLEMAAASGLALVAREARDPLAASSEGTGQLLAAAREAGASRFLIGIGGSATSDGGAGALLALGAVLTGPDGTLARASAADLASLRSLTLPEAWRGAALRVACDVDNPLLGPRGAAATFGPQKGADADQLAELEAGLGRWADLLEGAAGRPLRDVPGAGAAGGLGAGLLALGAELASGADLVLDAVEIDRRLAEAHLVITGEGSLDATTCDGKLISRLLGRARAAGVPTVAFAGRLGPGWEALREQGLLAALPLGAEPQPLHEALPRAAENLERLARTTLRLLRARLD